MIMHRLKAVTYKELKKSDKLLIILNNGDQLDRVFFQLQTDNHLIVHRYVEDDYVTVNKSDISELSIYISEQK